MILESVLGTFKHISALFKSIFTYIQNLFYPCIFRTLKYLKVRRYLDPCQTYSSVFGKQFQAIITFARSSSLDHFRCMAGFSIHLCISKYYLACTVILGFVSGIFRHTQALFKCILTQIQNLVYTCQIQNPGTFRPQGIFIIPY